MKKLDIYFAGSISGGRDYLDSYKKIVSHLKNLGNSILSEHVVFDDVMNYEKKFSNREIFERDLKWIDECNCIVAEVSNPSLGVGYEISYALTRKKPVLCLCEKDIFLTRMLTGNSSPFLKIQRYSNHTELINILSLYTVSISK